MLELLRIKNLALIDDMELEFSQGLNILTGESGAGKSFILRALDFILGEKLDSKLIRPGADKAQVEALFVIDNKEYLIRRVLTRDTGRSRLYLNDEMSGQEKIRNLAPSLLVHASQHSQQRLLKPAFHNQVLDELLPDQSMLKRKEQLLTKLNEQVHKEEELNRKCQELEERRELLEFQKNEIEKIGPKPGEEEELLEKKDQAKEISQYQESLETSMQLLHDQESGLFSLLHKLQRLLEPVTKTRESLQNHYQEIGSFLESMWDMDAELKKVRFSRDELNLEAIESRLFALSQLQRKLKKTLPEIVGLHQEIEDNLSFLDISTLERNQIRIKQKEIRDELSEVLQKLNTAREKAAQQLKQDLEKELQVLGFANHVQVSFSFTKEDLGQELFENRVRMLWAPNPGQPPQPLDKIASGGELSRFLLALIGLMSRAELPTLLFDEVDSGIGGVILQQVGARIRELASKQQILLITHWPQLAAMGELHLKVEKEVIDHETYTRCTTLTPESHIQELARMAGGGDQGMVIARELVDQHMAQEKEG